ncbi:MAG: hypothetical protein GY780_19075 [bacterium]|nr:hypothetical protein [bacterium]
MSKTTESHRLSRSGTLRSFGPDGRAQAIANHPSAAWDLWTMRALWPEAEWDDYLELREEHQQLLAREREAFAGLRKGDQSILAPGRRFLKENPELRSGLILSFHQGPYNLLAEPYLAAGLDPVILLNPTAKKNHLDSTTRLNKRLGHKSEVEWIVVGEPGFVRRLFAVVKAGRPVLIYLDGNNGSDGMNGTRKNGLDFTLPGRDVKVRTGVARLICRLQCPVHPVALHWNPAGEVVWEKQKTHKWSRKDDPRIVTRLYFDWIFSQIFSRPEQWHYWTMLRQASACFNPQLGESTRVPTGLRDDFIHAFNICLQRSSKSVRLILDRTVEVWPGDVLADLTEDRFYPAEGLRDKDLQVLRDGQPTLENLSEEHGLHWVKFHALRLCLLGMARLGG